MIGPKFGLIVELDQFQTVFVLLAERIRPVVVLIEYAELHRITFFPDRIDRVAAPAVIPSS